VSGSGPNGDAAPFRVKFNTGKMTLRGGVWENRAHANAACAQCALKPTISLTHRVVAVVAFALAMLLKWFGCGHCRDD